MKLEDVLLRQRQCAADWLIIQAHDLAVIARQTDNANLLVFACLEARNAIEQLWFEILILVHGGEMDRTLFEKCQRRRDGFLAAIGDAEPRYRQISKFTAIAMGIDSKAPTGGIAWDLGRLKNLWQSLSRYCHAQAHPAATIANHEWVASGFAVIDEVFAYLKDEMSKGATAILRPSNMKPRTRAIWEDFVAGKIDEEQTRSLLKAARS